jgi:hypothetical protein
MAAILERRKMLQQLLPEGIVVTRKWLAENANLEKHAIDNLVKSEQLSLLSKGLYTRGYTKISWQSIVYTLQSVMKLDYVVGGISALELNGYSHYLPIAEKKIIHIYGNDVLPSWVNEIVELVTFVKHSRNSFFENMATEKVDDFSVGLDWKEDYEPLKISCPEKACLEMLNELPQKITFEHADQLIQGMTNLSPRILQKLLEQCTNIKVKRLFLWFAFKHNYVWFNKLKTDQLYLGSGNRKVIEGGRLDKTYHITVPKNTQF